MDSALACVSVSTQRVHEKAEEMSSKAPPSTAMLFSTVTSDTWTEVAALPVVVSTPPLPLAVWLMKLKRTMGQGRSWSVSLAAQQEGGAWCAPRSPHLHRHGFDNGYRAAAGCRVIAEAHVRQVQAMVFHEEGTAPVACPATADLDTEHVAVNTYRGGKCRASR